MTFQELKSRVQTVLLALDKLSENGTMELKGLTAIQDMAGCSAILGEIAKLDELEGETDEKKTFK